MDLAHGNGVNRLSALKFPADALAFLRAGLRDPRRVSAVAPSGRALARLMTSEIVAGNGPVIELGPGTGAITRALLDRGVPERHLALIELDPQLAVMLRSRFPAARVLAIDAGRLRRVDPFDGCAAGSVVSGLPLLSLRDREIMSILSGAFRRLRYGGAFYQFTYGLRCPVPRRILKRLGLRAQRMGWVVSNIPPAAVYRIERPVRRSAASAAHAD
ncbi:MAG: class I SAM-dependent methyltransferase [Steroidobacteraceae bacterium]